LRPDAKWSDGRQIVATEFVQGLRRAVDPKTASGSAALLTIIKGATEITAGRKRVTDLGVAAIGESSVQIELEHPAPFVLQILSQPIAAPIHLSGDTSPATGLGGKSIATNGPYVLVTRIPNSFIELARNPYYWDFANVAIAKVRYVNAESEVTELREYIAGQLDMTFTIPMPDLSRISQQYGSEVQTAPFLGTLYLALNLSEPQIGKSRDLRQALSMAVDREAIAQHVMMGVTPAYALVAEGIRGYTSPEYEWAKWSREHQLTYAKSLFERAGYSAKKTLHLRLYFNRDDGIQRIMVAVAGSWKQNLGVESELISDEFRVFLAGRKDRNRWDVARLGWSADYDDPASFLDVFAHDNGQNDSGYESNTFNSLVDQARVEPQEEKRSILLRHSEQVLLEDYPIVPIYFYKARRLVKPYLGGAELTPMNHTYSKHLFWKSPS
jgi:oligopeptide transport system substrate-binding protein